MSYPLLQEHYRDLERRWKVVDRSYDYARLVVPAGNSSEPIHRWFHVKEAYSQGLLLRLFKDAAWSPSAGFGILDPFCGSGTTLLSAVEISRDLDVAVVASGIERNPFIHAVASAKVYGMTGGRRLIADLEDGFNQTLRIAREMLSSNSDLPVVHSSTLNNTRYYSPSHVQSFVALREALAAGAFSDEVRSILSLCIARGVEASGLLRRDGRALRYVPTRLVVDPLVMFGQAFTEMKLDLSNLNEDTNAAGRVLLGDGRRCHLGTSDEVDWIVFSPPYPNNIDYTEVYKTEAWALGYYLDEDDMYAQRVSTVRSHPSVKFADNYQYESRPIGTDVETLISPLLSAVPADRYAHGRRRLIKGYVDDMQQVLMNARRVVKPDGHLVFVVGNSVHGGADERFVIAADLLMARLGEMVGWRVEEIRIARSLRRRGSADHHLRESAVVLRPA